MDKLIISGSVDGVLPCARRAQNIRKTVQDKEYVYTQYLPSHLTEGLPLVVELHGGGGNGERQCAYTAWAELAERENFVVVFPSANSMVPAMGCRTWRCQQADFEADADYIMEIIHMIAAQFLIDTERIYISGMSLGDMMSTIFAAKYGAYIAGLCSFCGPTNPVEWKEKLRLDAEVPVIQIRGELDATLPFAGCGDVSEPEALAQKQEYLIWNRECWIKRNRADAYPRIWLDEKKNWALYPGVDCDVRYVEYCKMGHVEPVDGMALAWEHCFSRYRRTDHGIQRIAPPEDIAVGQGSFALAAGCSKAYTDKGIVTLTQAPVMGEPEPLPKDYWCTVCREDYSRQPALYAPLDILVPLLNGQIKYTDEGPQVTVHSEIYSFYADTYFVSTIKKHYAMEKPALLIDDQMWVPVRDTLDIMGFHCAQNDGVLFCTDHPCALSRGFAVLIRRLLWN